MLNFSAETTKLTKKEAMYNEIDSKKQAWFAI